MQPVIQLTHGIGQVEVSPIGSCHLHLYVQHCVGNRLPIRISIIVSITAQRGHRLIFHYVSVDDAVLSRRYGKKSSSLLTPSHDCLCTKAIVVEYVGFPFLGRLSLALSRHCSDCFLHRRAFYTFTRSHARGQKATQQVLTSICDASFGCLFMLSPDKMSSAKRTPVANAPLPNSLAVISLVLGTGEVGQCTAHLTRVIVVVIHLQNSPFLRRQKLSVTVTLLYSNGTRHPVSSLISISIDLKCLYNRGT